MKHSTTPHLASFTLRQLRHDLVKVAGYSRGFHVNQLRGNSVMADLVRACAKDGVRIPRSLRWAVSQ